MTVPDVHDESPEILLLTPAEHEQLMKALWLAAGHDS